MTAKFGFKNGGWKFTDNYDKELAFFGQNNVNTGGEQYQIHNHTTAGVTGVDPDPAAG